MSTPKFKPTGDFVTVLTEDGQKIDIDRSIAQHFGAIRGMLGIVRNAPLVPMPAVKSTILAKVVEFLEQHADDPIPSAERSATREDSDNNDDDSPSPADQTELPSSSESDDEYIYEEYLAGVTPWDQRFLDSLDLPTLIELTKAANYLNIPLLLDLCCRTVAKQMTGLKAEELRKKFNLPNDFTPEEEAKMAAEFAWIEE